MARTAVLFCILLLPFTFFEAKAYEAENERVGNAQGRLSMHSVFAVDGALLSFSRLSILCVLHGDSGRQEIGSEQV